MNRIALLTGSCPSVSDVSQYMGGLYSLLVTQILRTSPFHNPLSEVNLCHRVNTNGSTVLTKETVPAYNTVYEAPDIEEKNLSATARVRSSGPSMGHSINMAAITEIHELHQNNDERSCIHVELDITMGGIKYDHGDHVAILPENSIEVVEDAARCLGESSAQKGNA